MFMVQMKEKQTFGSLLAAICYIAFLGLLVVKEAETNWIPDQTCDCSVKIVRHQQDVDFQ